MQKVTVKIENDYSDGHHSEHEVEVDAPSVLASGTPTEEWWEEQVYEHLGDGHGIGNDLGYCYEATIVKADDVSLIGESMEWSGS